MVPGGLVDPFLPALGRQKALTPIVAAQEGGAAYMADGYARASGNLGVALCIGGPGLANAVTALATARTDGSPLLLMSGEVSTSLEGRGMFQDASPQTLDDVSMLKPIARYSSSIDNPKNLPHLFKRAMLQLRTQPSAPVHLSLPGDCLTGELSAELCDDRSGAEHIRRLSRSRGRKRRFDTFDGRSAPDQDRHSRRRGRGARRGGASAERIRRALADSGRDDAQSQGRASRRIIRCRSACSAMLERITLARRCSARRSIS